MAKFKLEKKELIFALSGMGFTLVWFLWLRDLIAPILQNIFPFLAMLLYNMGLFAGLLLMSELLKKNSYRWRILLMSFSIILGVGILSAPYLISHQGIANTNADYWYVSNDVGFASLWSLIVPLSWVWTMTYVISSTLMIFVIPTILGTSKEVAHLIK